MHRASVACALLVAVLIVTVPDSVGAAGSVDTDGNCVRHWDGLELLRGPKAILLAPAVPPRAFLLGVVMAPIAEHDVGLPVALLLPFGFAVAGVVEAIAWIGSGMVDTVTGGYWGLAPEKWDDGLLWPFVTTPDRDRCGRSIYPAPVRREPGPLPPEALRP
jgi:hypothetical protein